MSKKLLIGIDLGGTAIKFGIVNLQGKLLSKGQKPTPATRTEILKVLESIIYSLKNKASEYNGKISSAGIGSPGLVDNQKGIIIGRTPNIKNWDGINLKSILEKKCGIKINIENDANAMALAEDKFGAGKDYQTGLYITVGTGIGSGIIIEGKIWRGSWFSGAELGHIIIKKNGLKCNCGKKGCLEAYAGSNNIFRMYGKKINSDKEIKLISDYARQGDQQAQETIEKAADYLACGIGSALELLNPEIIVIGGGIASAYKYLPTVKQSLYKYASKSTLKGLIIRKAAMGNWAGVIGSAVSSIRK